MVMLFLAPFVLVASSVVVLGEWVTHHGEGFRSFLEAVFPGNWVATVPDGPHNAAAVGGVVGGVVVMAIIAVSLARRSRQRHWPERASAGRAALFGWMLLFSTVRTVIAVVGVVAVGAAIGIATGADLEPVSGEPLDGTGRWWAAGGGIVLWSVFFAVRACGRVPARAEGGEAALAQG
jgi:hypothetical protein